MSTEPKVFLHVGLHKTGTTFLQSRVFPHFPNYHLISRPFTIQNREFLELKYLPGECFDQVRLRAVADQIRSENPAKGLLFSDEEFGGQFWGRFLNREMIARRFSDIFPGAEVIVFLRGQVSLIESMYNQAIKAGVYWDAFGPDFLWMPPVEEDPANSNTKNAIRNRDTRYVERRSAFHRDHFFFDELVGMYEALFPRVHVLLYEDLRQDPEGTFARLEDILGDRMAKKPTNEKDPNPRLDSRELATWIYQRRLTMLCPGTNSKLLRAGAKALASCNHRSIEKENRMNFERFIDRKAYTENNRRLFSRRPDVGLDRHSEAYLLEAPPRH